MHVATTIAQARALFDVLPRPLGFVPTMGALHEGHMELVRRARLDCVAVAASVFVNPLQFGVNEDLERYPRDFGADRERLAAAGVDVVFAPDADTMYPPNFSTSIDPGNLARVFEGAARPGHFAGVATVVTKLLNIVRPDVLYLGQKDAQQTAVLRHVINDLQMPVRVDIVPTVRESDGLALSSRNAYLSPPQRDAAPALHRALVLLRDAMLSGAKKADAVAGAHRALPAQAALEYLDVVDADTFEPLDSLRPPAFVIGAARLGTTRLLDNLWIDS